MALTSIGGRAIDTGRTYVVAEIGINHNGSLEIAKRLIDVAASAGCDAVKFQKRTPEICVPPEQRDVMRDTPWGTMTYLEYKQRIEFGASDYRAIVAYCAARGIDWFASCWDPESVEFIANASPSAWKIASASVTNGDVLEAVRHYRGGKPVIVSTGMSTIDEVNIALLALRCPDVALLQATSAYPCDESDVNLRAMLTLRDQFQVPVGYSGHERGTQATLAAVALGACIVERHITLDRTMWGTDHAASLEPHALHRMVRDIRLVEKALGDGEKGVRDCELSARAKLRGES